MMIINYTYKDEERPINRARFQTKLTGRVLITEYRCPVGVDIRYMGNGRHVETRFFTKPDLADLISLLQRFYNQLPEVE